MDKAKQLKPGQQSAPALPIKDSEERRVSIVKESLSLDSVVGDDLAVGVVSFGPDAGPSSAETGPAGLSVRLLVNKEGSRDPDDGVHAGPTRRREHVGWLPDASAVDCRSRSVAGISDQVAVAKFATAGPGRGRDPADLWDFAVRSYSEDNRQVSIGRGLRGIQHSKTLLVCHHDGKAILIAGSSNWTTCSRANLEIGTVTEGQGDHELFTRYRGAFEKAWEAGTVFDGSKSQPKGKQRLNGKQTVEDD